MDFEQRIDIREYVGILKKRWWIPVALALIFAIVTAVYSYFFLSKIYQASTTLYVISKQGYDAQISIISDIQLGQALIKDYKEFVVQKITAKETITDLKLENKLSPEALISKIKVELKNDTRIMQITVTDNDPQMTAVYANKIAEVFSRKMIEMMNVENVQVIDKAETPSSPVGPNTRKNVSIAILVGVVIGIGVILLLEYLDNTIKSPDDVEKYLNLQVIVAIPVFDEATKKGDDGDEKKRKNNRA